MAIKPSTGGGWYSLVLGVVVVLLGLVIGGGGIKLMSLGGSAYYALAGLLLLVSGALLFLRRASGVWVYLALLLVTLVWALWEVGLNGWALMPRLLAPVVLGVFVLLALPAINKERV